MGMLQKKTLDGHVETLLTAVLLRGPSYGYLIVRQLNEAAPDILKLGEGTVYPVLHRMEERGLLTSRWETGPGGRPRKYYRVSQRGRRQFATAQQQWHALRSLMERIVECGPQPTSIP